MLDSAQQVWSLQKDESIKHLLILLFDHFGKTELVADVDNLCNDRAICLMHRNDRAVRLYIFTYGHAAEKYGVHVEYPIACLPYPASYENVSFTQLTDIVELNLDIVPVELLV